MGKFLWGIPRDPSGLLDSGDSCTLDVPPLASCAEDCTSSLTSWRSSFINSLTSISPPSISRFESDGLWHNFSMLRPLGGAVAGGAAMRGCSLWDGERGMRRKPLGNLLHGEGDFLTEFERVVTLAPEVAGPRLGNLGCFSKRGTDLSTSSGASHSFHHTSMVAYCTSRRRELALAPLGARDLTAIARDLGGTSFSSSRICDTSFSSPLSPSTSS